jgi:hypothetical protein
VSRQTVANLETGRQAPTVGQLIRWAGSLALDPSDALARALTAAVDAMRAEEAEQAKRDRKKPPARKPGRGKPRARQGS